MAEWHPGASPSTNSRRRNSSKPDSHWHVDGEEGHKKAIQQRRRTPEANKSPRHVLDHLDKANDRHAAANNGGDLAAFTAQMAKAEKAMLYRMRFEGEYMKKKQRDFDKHSKAEDEKKQRDANRAAVEARIKEDRERAQNQLQHKKMMAQNREVERSISSGLAAFKKVKKAQKDAKKYSDMNVLLSEQYSHINYLVEQKVAEIQKLESAARLKFLEEQQGVKIHKHDRRRGNKHASIKVRKAIQLGDTVPHMTIQQQSKEVEKYQHIVEHRLRNLGEIRREMAREKEEINRLRRYLMQKNRDLEKAIKDRNFTSLSLDEQRQLYTKTSLDCESIEQVIDELKRHMESDKDQFGKEWDDRMDTLTTYHREATRKVDEIGGQSRSRAKLMTRRKLSHLNVDRHSRLMGITSTMNDNHNINNQKMIMKREKKAVKTMDEAFQAITRATGIESLEELVDTFVHADRRNFSVVKHITALERDVDELSAELRDLKEMRKLLEHKQNFKDLSRRQKVTAMQRELEGLERQIEVHVAAHDRDKNVVNEIGPEVHSLFVQLGCRDNTVPEKFEPTFMTDRNLMRMLGLVDQQTVLLMTMFSNLDQKLSGTIENAGAVESQKKMEDAQRLRHRTSQLSRKPAPPKMGDFDDDSSDDESESEDSTTDSDTDTSSSSSDSEEEFLSKKEKRKKAKRKAEKKAKALEKEMKKRRLSMNAKKRKPNVSPTSRVIDAVQKPESILSLRKKVQRQIENGNHRHHHGSVIRFEPTRGKEHFKKRETGINGTGPMGTALGITPEQLASLQSFGK